MTENISGANINCVNSFMSKLSKESFQAVFKYHECIFLTFSEKDHNGIKLCWSGECPYVWLSITFYHFFLDWNNSLKLIQSQEALNFWTSSEVWMDDTWMTCSLITLFVIFLMHWSELKWRLKVPMIVVLIVAVNIFTLFQ